MEREFYIDATEELRGYVDGLLKQCEDSIVCIRDVYVSKERGTPVDKYIITENDYYRIRDYIKKKKRQNTA